MTALSSTPIGSDAAQGSRREPRRPSRILALALALLIGVCLVVYSVSPRPNPAATRGRITFGDGQVELTATQYVFRCIPSTNPSDGNTLSAQIAYELVNVGGSGVAVSVIMTLSASVIAEHNYTLGPHEFVNDTISARVAYAGNCQAPPVGLGMSRSYQG